MAAEVAKWRSPSWFNRSTAIHGFTMGIGIAAAGEGVHGGFGIVCVRRRLGRRCRPNRTVGGALNPVGRHARIGCFAGGGNALFMEWSSTT
jgi:hypothetical protein